jgi:hypothetical protein
MNTVVKFDQRAFRKGVNDALTLAPLREAIRNVTGGISTNGKSVVKDEGRNPNSRDVNHGNPTAGQKR